MKLAWSTQAWKDYEYWRQTDAKVFRAINDLINDTKHTPFKGLGKPEPLKFALKGWWSRRITAEHRLVYRVSGKGDDQRLEIASCRYHYE
jgi:toxin YoeB